MARPAYSPDKRERIEADIRKTALKLFNEQGYRNVSMRAIGRALELSATALYRYFANKEALLAAIRADGFAALKTRLQQVQTHEQSAVATVREALAAYLTFAVEDRDLYGLMYQLDQTEVADDPTVAGNRREAFAEAERIAQTLIDATGQSGDANLLAHIFWIGAHGLAALTLAQQLDLGKSFDALVEPLVRTLVSANLQGETNESPNKSL